MQDDLKSRVERLRVRLRAAPADSALHRELADLLLGAGKIAAGINILEKSLRDREAGQGNGDARRCFERGLEFADAYLYEDAVECFCRALRGGLDNFEVHYCLAGVYKSLEAHAAAERHCRKAVELNPRFPPAFILLGSLLRLSGDYSECIKACKKALLLDPDCTSAYYDLACYYSLSGEQDKALAALEMALCKGFSDFDWIQRDADLSALRENPEFVLLLRTYRQSPA